MHRLFFILSFAVAAHADTAFQKIQSDFARASLPDVKQIEGVRSGRCVEANDAERYLPALFLTRTVQERNSFTYYRHESAKPDAYDALTTQQAEASISGWLKQEQWQSIQAVDNALVTYYDMAGGIRLERAVRVLDDKLILEVLRNTGALGTAVRYCYFDRVLSSAAVTPPVDPSGRPVARRVPHRR